MTLLITWNCQYCNIAHNSLPWKIGKYCDSICHKKHIRKLRISNWISLGKDWNFNFPNWVKEYLIDRDGPGCKICSITQWNNLPIILDGDHIDGNSKNNHPSNLRLLCPNCHSQTSTYKNRNKGNGRSYRNRK